MDDLDLAKAMGDDSENFSESANFSESESNLETADPEEFDLILPKGDQRKSAANMEALWGSVLAPTTAEKYSRHSHLSTNTQDIDLGAHQSRSLLTQATFDRQMVTRSVSAPEIDLQRTSRLSRSRETIQTPLPTVALPAVPIPVPTVEVNNDRPEKQRSTIGSNNID
jgi:hypothetical protein